MDFPWLKTFSFWIWKGYQRFIRRCVSVPNFIGIMFWTFPVLHFFFRIFLEKNFIECVSSPYVENFTLLDSNLTNSMKSKILMVVNIKVIRFDILSKWKSYNLQYLGMIQTSLEKKTRSSQVLVWSSHKQILNFFIFSSKKKVCEIRPIFHHYVNLVKMKNVPFPFWIFPQRHSSFLRRSNNVSKGYSTW